MSIKKYPNFFRKYLKLKKYQLINSKKPITCMIAITHNCNSKCLTCNFWKKDSKNELTLEEIKKIFSSPVMSNLVNIGISGGEPLLRKDINEAIRFIYDITKIKPTISTNGFLPRKVESLIKEDKDILRNIGTSIDGLEKTHEKIRGIPDCFKKVEESIQIIKNNDLKPNIDATISKLNYKELPQLIEKYKDYDFDFKIAQTSKYYYADNTKENFGLDEKAKREFLEILDKLKPIVSIHKLYSFFLKDWITKTKRPRCYAGRFEIFIDAQGNIYPCIHKPALGNIRESSLEEIWYSQEAQKARRIYSNCKDCYERCTTSDFWISPFKWRLIAIFKKIFY